MSMEINSSSLGNNAPNPVTLSQITAKEFSAKFKSKRECYTFLATECEVYLPPYGMFLTKFNLTILVLQIT